LHRPVVLLRCGLESAERGMKWKRNIKGRNRTKCSVKTRPKSEAPRRKCIPTARGSLRKGKTVGSDLNRYFSRMGARVKVLEREPPSRRWGMSRSRQETPRIVLDIRRDKHGEYFEIRTAPGSEQEIVVLNVQPREKHLLLLSRQFGEQGQFLAKQKFLCGHDERHWFVAAIPENEPVSTVADAKVALKPAEVRAREGLLGISRSASFRRRNSAFIRQGEWFFVPTALKADPLLVLKNEPLSRGNGGKPHWAEECHRSGGDTVYVSANIRPD
jgi:hypothetical protein